MGLDISHFFPSAKASDVGDLEYFTVEELSECAGYIERHKHLLVEGEDDLGKTEIMYVVGKGYQHKGMNSNFFKDFQNGKPYFDLESVRKAYQYLQTDHISSLEELQQNFQKNFIDSFVEGESIFCASW